MYSAGSDIKPKVSQALCGLIHKRIKGSLSASYGALCVGIFALLLGAGPVLGQTETVLYNLCSLPTYCLDGANPVAGLTSDGAGNFYGTTLNAGPAYGNVFELIPNGNYGLDEVTLHHFTLGLDGAYPRSSVIFDDVGNLYGTACAGGASGYGVVFELSGSGPDRTEAELYSFANTGDGAYPCTALIRDQAGNLYGATVGDQNGGLGTIYELVPSGSGWTEEVIYSFPSSTYISPSGLAMDLNGNIFAGIGLSLLEFSPNGSGGWTSTVIYTFAGGYPSIDSTPVLDGEGNIYGTIMHQSKTGLEAGLVYKLSHIGNSWSSQTLRSWGKGTGPEGGLVLDSSGNIYGTTIGGGNYGYGTVFELSPGIKRYRVKVLWNFNGADGATPLGGLILDNAGNVYGTTWAGGMQDRGTAFEVTP
jgi:hypothetical protein